MELLLNIFWLLLALPAFLLWRRNRGFYELRGLLALSCMLVFLFPVISATDDLLAWQQVVEESGPSRRTLQQGASHRAPACNHFGSFPAGLGSFVFWGRDQQAAGQVAAIRARGRVIGVVTVRSGRSPPISLFA